MRINAARSSGNITLKLLETGASMQALRGETVVMDGENVIAVIHHAAHAKAFYDAITRKTDELTVTEFLSKDERRLLQEAADGLLYLADHERPVGGEQRFNSAWLYETSRNVRRLAQRAPLTPAPLGDPLKPSSASQAYGNATTSSIEATITAAVGVDLAAKTDEAAFYGFEMKTGKLRPLTEDQLPDDVREAFGLIGKAPPENKTDEEGPTLVGQILGGLMEALKDDLRRNDRERTITNATKDRVKSGGIDLQSKPWDASRSYLAGDVAVHGGKLWTFWPQYAEYDHTEDEGRDEGFEFIAYGYGFTGIEPGAELHDGDAWWLEMEANLDSEDCGCVGCQIIAAARPYLTPLTAPAWDGGNKYNAGDRVSHEGKVWEATCRIYNDLFDPGGEYSERATPKSWKQVGVVAPAPLTAPDYDYKVRYKKGDRVAYEGQVWVCNLPAISNPQYHPGGTASERICAWEKVVAEQTDGLAEGAKTE